MISYWWTSTAPNFCPWSSRTTPRLYHATANARRCGKSLLIVSRLLGECSLLMEQAHKIQMRLDVVLHFIQEEQPKVVGRTVADWRRRMGKN